MIVAHLKSEYNTLEGIDSLRMMKTMGSKNLFAALLPAKFSSVMIVAHLKSEYNTLEVLDSLRMMKTMGLKYLFAALLPAKFSSKMIIAHLKLKYNTLEVLDSLRMMKTMGFRVQQRAMPTLRMLLAAVCSRSCQAGRRISGRHIPASSDLVRPVRACSPNRSCSSGKTLGSS
jgi:aryl carrier-like protein